MSRRDLKKIEVVDLTGPLAEWTEDEDVFDAAADLAARMTGVMLDRLALVDPREYVAGRLFERPLPFPMA